MTTMNNGIITINRGDTVDILYPLKHGNRLELENFNFNSKSEIYLGILEPKQPWEFALIRKKYTIEDLDANNNLKLHLDRIDTINVLPGLYFYEIKVRLLDEDKETIITVIPRRKFYIQD